MKRLFVTAVLIAAFPLILSETVLAQIAVTRLEGTVQDEQGNAIPGAVITAIQNKSVWKVQVTSDSEGRFVFPALQHGTYSVSVEAKGYRPIMHTNVVLDVPGGFVERFTVVRGSAKEVVTENAIRERIQSSESQVSGAITRRDLEVLPLLFRDPLALAVYQPGVLIQGGDAGVSSVNGTRQGSNNLRLDGADVNDPVNPRIGFSTLSNNADSIEQFTVITTGAKAEFGRNSGAQVLLTTRAGGNRWSGNVFDYFRNKVLNANDFFNNASNIPNPKYDQNIFGASFAGPAIKDRTFIFGNFQGRRTTQDTVENNTVLTSTAKSGVFQWIPFGSTNVNTYDIVRNDPRKLGIDPRVASTLKQLPDSNNTDIGDGLNTAGYRFNDPIDSNAYQSVVRADHKLKDNHRLFFRFNWGRSSSADVANGALSPFPGLPQGTIELRNWGGAAGSDWAINPTMANEFRFGYQRAKVNLDRPARAAGAMFLANTWTDPLNTSFARWRNAPVMEAEDNLIWIKGNHSIKAGFRYSRTSQEAYNETGIYPNITFGRDYGNLPPSTIGPPSNTISQSVRQQFEYLYNDLLGRMETVTQTFYGDLATYYSAGTARSRSFLFREYGAFLQDDWKIRPNLTLNLGVRYEFGSVPSESNGIQGALDNAASISSTANISNFTLQRGGAWYKTDGNNFGPRVGFAWAPFNSTKMVLRGGYGVFFDRLAGQTTDFVDNNTPASAQITTLFPNLAGTDRRLSDGIPLPSQPAAPASKLPDTRSTTAAIFKPDLKTGYMRHFNLTLQRQILANTIVEAGYVGERGVDLFMNLNLNQLKVAGDFLQSFKELQNFRFYGTPVSSANTLVKIFGSVNSAISAIGGSTLDQGLAGTAADTVDRNYFGRYAAAGVSDFYLRNYPQFDQLIQGSNDGTSSYDAFQLNVRRNAGPLKVNFNYTLSKSVDTISTDCGECTLPLDSINPKQNKAPSDFDRRRVISAWGTYDLPFGKSRTIWSDASGFFGGLVNNWTMGMLTVWATGPRFSVSSGLPLVRESLDSLANYTGSRKIGGLLRETNGVYWFTNADIQNFTFPGPGEIGNSGRNSFVGPGYFNIDVSLLKSFRVRKEKKVTFRAEVYNVLNKAHFGQMDTNLSDGAAFSKFSATQGTPRIIQVALRYDF